MGILLLKLTLAPTMVVAATLAGRRWGARIGGILTATPLVAGPILLVITLQQGHDFGARAARGSLLGIAALAAFCVVFARASPRLRWPRALLAGWLAFALVGAAGSRLDAPPLLGLAAALGSLALARVLLGRDDGLPIARSAPPAWDLYARAGSTALLVFTITTAASTLGPGVSGILTPFPIATSVLAAFTLAADGPRGAQSMLRGFVLALPGFAVFFFGVAVLLGG